MSVGEPVALSQMTEEFRNLLPAVASLLAEGNLAVHPSVRQVNLEGSRGLAGGARPDSDLDLSLLVDDTGYAYGDPSHEALLQAVLDTTLNSWQGALELDLAALFDQRECGLSCFDQRVYSPAMCTGEGGVDCGGLYKVQRGFTGYVPAIGVRVELMYPTIIVWRRGSL